MMINLKRAMKSNRLLKALTGLKLKQFELLAVNFNKHIEIAFLKFRAVNINLGRKSVLPSSGDKLFYILFYLKCYPTFDVASYFFNVDRSTCCRWVHWFISALEMALGKRCVLPKRESNNLENILKNNPEILDIFIDGTERPIRRPKDKERQKDNYSGKKKRHTRKNLVITTKDKRILILTKTNKGSKHDYGIFKEENFGKNIPKRINTIVDNGFQGIEKDYPKLKVLMPKRKPKGRELTNVEKKNNRAISSNRVINEHAIGGIKRLRVVSDVFRNTKEYFDDKVMLAASGIWNFYLKYSN